MIPPPPDMLLMEGSWIDYEEELHRVFMEDIAGRKLSFRGKQVNYRKRPKVNGRHATFWHITTTGEVESERVPDPPRCERLPWLRWVIEHADQSSDIDIWENIRKTHISTVLWYLEEYLVALEERDTYWLLRTAFYTQDDEERTRDTRRERDLYRYRPSNFEKRRRRFYQRKEGRIHAKAY